MVSSTNGGIEQRVYMHWKSLKYASEMKVTEIPCDPNKFCEQRDIYDGCECPACGPHRHYRRDTATSNNIWLLLAERHKMPVRQVKDIINAKRGK